jgi:hypothetical protein
MQRFGRHTDERHDLQELLLPGVTELLDVVTACNTWTCFTAVHGATGILSVGTRCTD